LNQRALQSGYAVEVDLANEQSWCEILRQFDDANLYQTWAYAAVISGRRNLSHLVLRHEGKIVAVAQARIARLPLVNLGVAYVRWGPLWHGVEANSEGETLRQAIRALRNEYVCRRGLVLRLFPLAFDDNPRCAAMLEEEGFVPTPKEVPGRTILIDMTVPLLALREGMARNWKRNLKAAEQNDLEVIEGSSVEMFEAFIAVYKQMVSRKNFVEPNDIHQFQRIQAQLPEEQKMQIMLCKSGGEISAGLIWSALGNMGIELFAATSDAGITTKGSYLLRWKLVEKLKQGNFRLYNLNGINPVVNPGGYKFKNELAGKNGRDVHYLGRFDAHGSSMSRWFIESADALRGSYGQLKGRLETAHQAKDYSEKTRVGAEPGPAAKERAQVDRAALPVTRKTPRPPGNEFQPSNPCLDHGESDKEKMNASLR
jgi:hypothetical protein